MKLSVIMVFVLFSFMSFAEDPHKGMGPEIHEAHMKCLEKAGKSMDDCMRDKSCKECINNIGQEKGKKEEMKPKK